MGRKRSRCNEEEMEEEVEEEDFQEAVEGVLGRE